MIFKVKGLSEAAIYGEDYYERKGANLEKISARRISELLDKFRQEKRKYLTNLSFNISQKAKRALRYWNALCDTNISSFPEDLPADG